MEPPLARANHPLERFWFKIAGPGDLGPVDFDSLVLPSSPNYFLVCPEDSCPGVKPGLIAPVFSSPAARLRQVARETWGALPRVECVAHDDTLLEDRYLYRSRILRFPDTITVRFIGLNEQSSSLVLYSRSQIGYSDLGANRNRAIAWLSMLEMQLSQ